MLTRGCARSVGFLIVYPNVRSPDSSRVLFLHDPNRRKRAFSRELILRERMSLNPQTPSILLLVKYLLRPSPAVDLILSADTRVLLDQTPQYPRQSIYSWPIFC